MRSYCEKVNPLILKTFLPFLILITAGNAFSQDSQALMLEPEFNVRISTDSRWSYGLGLANRGLLIDEIQADNYSENVTEHIEVNSWLIYETGENEDVSLGIRYRFRELFDPENENLFRILQQYYSEQNSSFLGWWQRARFEQRFGPTITIFRLRYQLGISKPLSEEFALELHTEALYSISKQFKPQPEQRIAIGVANSSFENWDINLDLEYRMDNYIRDQQNNLFIMTIVTLSL